MEIARNKPGKRKNINHDENRGRWIEKKRNGKAAPRETGEDLLPLRFKNILMDACVPCCLCDLTEGGGKEGGNECRVATIV